MTAKKGKPLEKKRHCSICGLPGHTKAAHKAKPVNPRARKRVLRRNPLPKAYQRWVKAGMPDHRKRIRRNVDGFVAGGFHPIRSSEGYSPLLAGEDRYLDSVQVRTPAALRLGSRIMELEGSLSGSKLSATKAAKVRGQLEDSRRRLAELDKRHKKREAEEQRKYESQLRAAAEGFHSQGLRAWRAEVRRAVKAVSPEGIAPHSRNRGGSALRTEYRLDIPINLRGRNGLPADEVADLLHRDYPHLQIESEDDLLSALRK